jgi:hypothetical protein
VSFLKRSSFDTFSCSMKLAMCESFSVKHFLVLRGTEKNSYSYLESISDFFLSYSSLESKPAE